MYDFEKKNSKIFSPEGPHENVSPGPAVALDGPNANQMPLLAEMTSANVVKISQRYLLPHL